MKKILPIISFIIAGFSINAQTTMNIHQSNGSVLTLPLNTIDSITYTVGNPGNLATLSTLPIGSITENSAISGVNITSNGGSTVTEHGICWNTSPSPSTSDNTIVGGSGTGNFTVPITGLDPNTEYFIRAYAINSAGTAYGNELSFTTNNGIVVTVPSTYVFEDENGNNTVAFLGQTQRMDMLSEMKDYMTSGNQGATLDPSTLLAMYDNSYQGWIDQSIVGTNKQLKSKTALGDAGIQARFEAWMTDAATASPISSGSVLQSSTGLYWRDLVEKGLMSACFANQITCKYLVEFEFSDNTVPIDPSGGKFYTEMEHDWDEAYGYFTDAIDYPASGTDRFWGKYATPSEEILGLSTSIPLAFRTGRAAISAGDIPLAIAQRDLLISYFKQLVAAEAIRYLNMIISDVQDGDSQEQINTTTTKALAFIYGIQFISLSPDLSPAQIESIVSQIEPAVSGFSQSTPSINAVKQMIAEASGLTSVMDDL